MVLLIVIAILLFGFIIFIHELGHFVTAKLSGIRVNEFALGMGPTLFHFGKGETRYALRLLPIGGFCAMEGEDGESEDDRAFNRKPIWKRMLVVLMGAVMNILLGLVLMMIILAQQPLFASTTISRFQESGSALQSAGIQVGDTIVNIDGYGVQTDRDMTFALSTATATSNTVDIQVNRAEQGILTFNDVKLSTREVEGHQLPVLDFYVQPIEKNVGTLIMKSVQDTVSTVRSVWYTLAGMVTGKYGFSDLSGPIGVASEIGKAASQGLESSFMDGLNNVLFMMMIITVNLGVVNLLPLPALDGGRFLLLLVEAIRRKPLNPKYEGWINAAGFILLMGLMVLVAFSDILRLVTGKGLGA